MPLSIKKFDRFLEKHGIITSLFYTDADSYCRMIEVYSTMTDETFMIYISSSCQMTIGTGSNVFSIKELEYNETGDILDRYGDSTVIGERSSQHDVLTASDSVGNIEARMQDMYKKQVRLSKNVNDTVAKDVYRQVSRLAVCVSHMKFKVCIQTPELVYFTDPASDVIRIFSITNNLSRRIKNVRRLNIIIDIETLFDTANSISKDVSTIKKQLVANIHDNITRNISSSHIPLSVTKKWNDGITRKLIEYNNRIDKLNEKIEQVSTEERAELERKIALESKTEGSISMFTLNKNVEFANQLSITNKKLSEISDIKREMYLNITSLTVKHDNLILVTDSTVFDIVVLSDTIRTKTDHMLKL